MTNEIKEIPFYISVIYKKYIHRCPHCNSDMEEGKIFNYPHPEGWVVPTFQGKQWLYIVCPKCGVQFSLYKLGINKDFSPNQIDLEKSLGRYHPLMVYCNECKKAIEISSRDKYEALKNHVNIFHPFLFD